MGEGNDRRQYNGRDNNSKRWRIYSVGKIAAHRVELRYNGKYTLQPRV